MPNQIEEIDAIEGECEEIEAAALPVVSTELATIEGTVMDTVPQFAISLDEARQRFADLRQFCRDQLREGEDYGIIPGCGNKPALFKPGAEKLNALFGLAPLVQTLHREVDIRGNYVEYEIKVILIHKATGRVEAEGVGSCSNQETKYIKQSAANVANTVLKMAKKRALVDATLSATRVSGLFTQDTEDMPRESFQAPQRPPQQQQAPPRATASQTANYAAQRPQNGAPNGGGGDLLSDPQHRAILAIAGRAYGRENREADLQALVKKPLESLTKSEASGVIESLRALLRTD